MNDELQLTRPDAIKLSALAEDMARLTTSFSSQADELEELLEIARIVAPESIPAGVVTLDSEVEFEDLASGERRKVTLVLPKDLDPAAGRISVVSPMGRALLGRSVGDLADVVLPDERKRQVRLVGVPFQPEAHAVHCA